MKYIVEIETTESLHSLQKILDDMANTANDPSYRGYGWKPPIQSISIALKTIDDRIWINE